MSFKRVHLSCGVLLVGSAFAGCSTSDSPTQEVLSTKERLLTLSSDSTDSAKLQQTTAEPAPNPLPEGDSEDGGYTISQVMQLAHESKLYRRLFNEPIDEEILQMLRLLYADLPKRQPPKGDIEQWRKRSRALVEAIDAIERGDPKGVSMLKRSVNCSSCHDRHRES
ncbi:hypothetical protein [Roseiconus lacunae]|uniref:hypothetical protein n=1 Tax=Roseiconus lacunae TaxID=2605694 RepID=UPI00135A3421|nr:hypothetical protein [Roseiconus lacunae]